jgi:hypothetical protein
MASRTQKDLLGDTGVRTNLHLLKVENINLLSQPDEVAKHEPPGKVDIDARLDHDATAKLSPKQTQNANSQTRGPRQTCGKEKTLK